MDSMQRVFWYVQCFEKDFSKNQMAAFGEERRKELSEKRRELAQAKKRVKEIDSLQRFIDKVKCVTQLTELTPEIVHEFIERIVVSKPEYIDGQRYQSLDIYYNSVGIVREPMPEEMEELFQEHMRNNLPVERKRIIRKKKSSKCSTKSHLRKSRVIKGAEKGGRHTSRPIYFQLFFHYLKIFNGHILYTFLFLYSGRSRFHWLHPFFYASNTSYPITSKIKKCKAFIKLSSISLLAKVTIHGLAFCSRKTTVEKMVFLYQRMTGMLFKKLSILENPLCPFHIVHYRHGKWAALFTASALDTVGGVGGQCAVMLANAL